jgi:hypothetical protein
MILILLVDCSHALLSGTAEGEDARLRQQHGLDHPAVVNHLLKSVAEDFWAESDISYHKYRQVLVGGDEKRCVRSCL